MLLQNTIYELIIPFESLIDGGINICLLLSIFLCHEFPVLLPGKGFVFGEHAKDLVSVNDGQRVILAGIGMMATPSVGIEPFNNLCPNGVFMDIFDQTEKIGLSITKDGFVASLKQVTNCTVSPVEVHRVGLVQALHDFGQGDIADLHEQMNVIVHEDIGVDKASGAVLVVTEE